MLGVSAQHSWRIFREPKCEPCAHVGAVCITQLGDDAPGRAGMAGEGRDGCGGQGWHSWQASLAGIPPRVPDRSTPPARSQFSNVNNFPALHFFSTLHAELFLSPPPPFSLQQRLFYKGGAFPIQGLKSCVIQYFGGGMMRGNNYTAAQPVALVLSDCLANFQRRASSHYRNYHILWLFALPLIHRIPFNKTFVIFSCP